MGGESVYHARTSQGPRLTGISFIVTVFDKRLYLPAVIESLARQEGPFEREFVFVDDGSSDGSADLIAELTRGWRDKVLILHQPNRGASSATNEGAWRASYPWLKFLDGDDLLVPGATARLLEAASATRQSFAYGDLGTYRLDAPDPLGDGDPLQAPIILEPDGLARFIRNCPSNSSTMLVTSERYWQAGGCDERLISPDQALFLRLFAVGGGARVMGPVALAPQSAPGRLSEQRRRSRYESVLALYYLVTERKEIAARHRDLAYRRALARARTYPSRLRRPVPVAPSAALSREPASACRPSPAPACTRRSPPSPKTARPSGRPRGSRRRSGSAKRANPPNPCGPTARREAACAASPASSILTIASTRCSTRRSRARWPRGSSIAGPTRQDRGAIPRPGIALGFRRLSIVDLSAAGHSRCCRRTGLRHALQRRDLQSPELRARLEAGGRRLRGHSDTEEIVEGARWGVRATLERAIGMFALGAVGPAGARLFLARDRLGKKPLYYGWIGGVFAVRLGAEGAARRMRGWTADSTATRSRSICASATSRRRATIFRRRAETRAPAPRVEISARTARARRRALLVGSRERAARPARRGFRRASRRSRGPAGCAFSTTRSGCAWWRTCRSARFFPAASISSTVVALMQAQSTRAVRSFCHRLSPSATTTRRRTRPRSRAISAPITPSFTSRRSRRMARHLPSCTTMYDEPFADSSQIPTFLAVPR